MVISAVVLSYALGVGATTQSPCSTTATCTPMLSASAQCATEQAEHHASCSIAEGDDVAWTTSNFGTWRSKAAWKSDDAWLSRPTDALMNVKLTVSASVINIQ